MSPRLAAFLYAALTVASFALWLRDQLHRVCPCNCP